MAGVTRVSRCELNRLCMILFCTFWGRVLLRSLRVYILKQLFFLKPRWIVAEYLPRFQRIANYSVSPVLWTESVIMCLHRLDVTEVHLEKKSYWHFSSCSFGLDGKIKQTFVVRLFRCVGTARSKYRDLVTCHQAPTFGPRLISTECRLAGRFLLFCFMAYFAYLSSQKLVSNKKVD